MAEPDDDKLFADLSRPTTSDEREAIDRIELKDDDLDKFMDLLRKGLIEASAAAEQAVQDNFALRVETSIRVSRPVYDKSDHTIGEVVGRKDVSAKIAAKKVYKK